ncbi:MAG TPA: hypothetical protein VGQ36_00380 [Thermoanaerobaculia bacterium]|jgi:hypothetical protein|nr:hypothetical protein [Thermoanaerobaculia bacterium]
MAPFFKKKFEGGIAKDARCPVCGGRVFYRVPLGRADAWYRQLEGQPQWKRFRGLPENAGVAFSEPRLEWDQPTFDHADKFTEHVRCGSCASLLPPQFLDEGKSRVLLITAGMPQAGKTTWLKCLFSPAQKKHLIVDSTTLISRDPYYYIEPYTIANPDPRTAVPILLHGMKLQFQRKTIQIAGIDIKGEVFHQRTSTPDKYMRVLDILKNLRSMTFAELFVMFVVPFDPTRTRQNIGQLTAHLTHQPGSRGTWQGVIWTHLDHAQLRTESGLLDFLQSSEPAVALARRVIAGTEDPFDSKFVDAASEIERLVQKKQNWTAHLDVLESLTWLLYRIMVAYHAVPVRLRTSNVEFYYTGVGSVLVKQCMRLASALFAAWDGAGRGDFAPMIRESMMPGTELQFPVLPCGIEFLHDSAEDGQPRDGLGDENDGLPVWGDLLLLEILRRHG